MSVSSSVNCYCVCPGSINKHDQMHETKFDLVQLWVVLNLALSPCL